MVPFTIWYYFRYVSYNKMVATALLASDSLPVAQVKYSLNTFGSQPETGHQLNRLATYKFFLCSRKAAHAYYVKKLRLNAEQVSRKYAYFPRKLVRTLQICHENTLGNKQIEYLKNELQQKTFQISVKLLLLRSERSERAAT